jgi:Domain of unknown function (DUF6602)
MDPADYYRSLTAETDALKDRVRQLIDDTHWLTDGEWKESVVRSVLRRHLPPNIVVGRGFVIAESAASSQIDVLIYDASYPLLHQDGDLVFVTPDAVRGIIEVKSTLRRSELKATVKKLVRNAALLSRGAESAFVGLFGYEAELGTDAAQFLLSELHAGAGGVRAGAVNHVCAGKSCFVRFWTDHPFDSQVPLDVWRAYPMEDMARGYFISNAVEVAVGKSVRDNLGVWYPQKGKSYTCEQAL